MSLLRSMFRILIATAAALLVGTASMAAPPPVACTPVRAAAVEIPREAHAILTYVRAHNEAPAGFVGGRRFGNYGKDGEQKLPLLDAQGKAIEYREWDIHPKVPGRNRGAERLVTGSDGRAWYTADHYSRFTEIE